MKPTLTFLHTADIHLGAKFVGWGAKAADQRQRLREVLFDIVVLAGKAKVDFCLFAGDIFDSNTPSRESREAFQKALGELREKQIPAIAIAGTHDYLGKNSILAQLAAENIGQFILLTPDHPLWQNQEKQVILQGTSLLVPDHPLRPLEKLKRSTDLFWQIGMAHAALDMGDLTSREAAIAPREIAASGFDYLALGHWHGLRNCSEGSTACWYSGSPELIAWDEEKSGSVLKVQLREGEKPSVQAYRVGKRSCLRLTLPMETEASILEALQCQTNPDQVLELTLKGMISPEVKPDLEKLKTTLTEWFFYVRILDASQSELTQNEINRYPENTVAGCFIQLLQAEKQLYSQEPEKQKELDQVLQLGLSLLSGREVAFWI